MRTIKFRGKGYNNEWYYGSLLIDKEGNPYIMQSADISYNCVLIDEAAMFPVIPETVGQFTGLYDNDRAEIYEGDILNHLSNGEELRVIVQWNDKIASLCINEEGELSRYAVGYFTECLEAHVIGNIHDNPELIKGSV